MTTGVVILTGPVTTISSIFAAGSATAAHSWATDGTRAVPSAAEPVQSFITSNKIIRKLIFSPLLWTVTTVTTVTTDVSNLYCEPFFDFPRFF